MYDQGLFGHAQREYHLTVKINDSNQTYENRLKGNHEIYCTG